MPEEVKRTLVQLDVDKAASQRVQQETARLKQNLEAIEKSVRSMAGGMGDAEKRFAKYGKEARSVGKHIDQLADEIDDAEKVVKKLDKSMQGFDGAKQMERDLRAAREEASLYGDVESRTRALTGAVGFVGGAGGEGIERTVNIGAEVLASAEAIKLLKLELPEMTANLVNSVGGVRNFSIGLGAAALATTGIVVALKTLSDAAKESRQAVEAEIEFERRRAELNVESLTTDAIEEQSAALQESIDIREREIERLQEDRDAHFDSYNALEQLGEATGLYNQGLDDYDKRLEELTKTQDAEIKLLDEVTEARESEFTAINDQIEAQKKLTEQRQQVLDEAGQKILDDARKRADAEARILEQALTVGDSGAVDRQREKLHIQYRQTFKDLQALSEARRLGLLSLDEYREGQRAVNEEQDFLIYQMGLLEDVLRPAAEAAESEARVMEGVGTILGFVKDQSDAAFDGMDQLNDAFERGAENSDKAAEKLDEYYEKQAEVDAKRDLDLAQDAEKFALERVNTLADHYKDMAELDSDYYAERADLLTDLQDDLGDIRDERLEALKDHNKESERLAQDHYDDLEQIQTRAQSDIASASAELDALAIYKAQKRKEQDRREEDFKDQLKQYRKERRDRLQHYDRQLRDLERAHYIERQREEAAFREELRREDQQRALEFQHQQQQWALEDQQRAAHYNTTEILEGQHQQELEYITIVGMGKVEDRFASSISNMESIVATANLSPGATTTIYGGTPERDGNLPIYDYGGQPPLYQDVIVGGQGPEVARFTTPTTIYPNANMVPAGGAMNGAQIVINIDGSRDPHKTAYLTRREFENVIGAR